MWQGINLEICWILISQWKSTRNGPGYELCKIVLCTRECSGLVLREGKVNVWLWRQIAEESKMLRALESQAGRCTPLGRKRFFHKHQLPSSPFYSHKKGKPGSAALSFFFLSLLHSRSIWAASLHPYGSGIQRCWHSTACAATALRSWPRASLALQGPPINPAGVLSATPPFQQRIAFHTKKNTYFGKQKTINPMPTTSKNIFHKI